MNLGAVLLSWFLVTVAHAVSVKDAFKKDWVHYNSGPISRRTLLDHETVVELSQKNILYYRDVSSSRVTKYIDFSLHQSDDYVVGKDTIATFSTQSHVVSIFEKNTGVFISAIELASPPASIQNCGSAWTILQDGSGELVTWDGRKLHSLGTFHARSFVQHSTPTETYILVDSTAIKLTGTAEGSEGVLEVSPVDYSATVDLLYPPGIVDEIRLTTENGSPVYVSDTTAVGYHGPSLVIYTFSAGVPQILYRKTFDDIVDVQASGHTLAVITRSKAYILDLGKFLENGSGPSIKSQAVKMHPHMESAVLSAGHFSVLHSHKGVFIHDFEVASAKSSVHRLPESAFSATGPSILVDFPPSLSKIEEVHHLAETRTFSIVHRWLVRVKTHLAQFGKFVSQSVLRKASVVSSDDDVFGLDKLLIQVDQVRSLVAAKNTKNGQAIWVHELQKEGKVQDVKASGDAIYVIFDSAVEVLDLRSGASVSSRAFDHTIEKVYALATETKNELDELDEHDHALAVKTGAKLEFLTTKKPLASQYIVHQNAHALEAYKIDGTTLKPTWKWDRPGARVLAVSKNSNAVTPAGGIARYDRSVLYKYLNPNLVSVIYEQSGVVTFTLLDGVSGAVVHTQEHRGDSIDPDSVTITQQDNWVVYSMYVTCPKSEQRFVVIDLFQGEKSGSSAKSSFRPQNVTVSSQAFIYPERVLSLASTSTKFGVTVKSVVALTESGSLVEIPKFLLNSRRIDGRKMTNDDAMDDFRMLPYEPVIPENTFKVLNHKNKLQLSSAQQTILVQPTELESTSVVCFVNEHNEFCTVVQPSSSYDVVKSDFDKTKLILTIGVLLVGYVVTKPLVAAKKLNQRWVD